MNVGNRSSEAITFYGRNPPMLCNELSFDCRNGASGSRHCCRLRPNVNNKWRRLPLVKSCRRLRVNECDVYSQIWCKNVREHTFCSPQHPKFGIYFRELPAERQNHSRGTENSHFLLIPNEIVMESPGRTSWIPNYSTCRAPTIMISRKNFSPKFHSKPESSSADE